MTRLALILALATTPAVAGEQPVCMPLLELSTHLAGKYGEHPAAGGVIKGGVSRLVVWANPDSGTWTSVIVGTNGTACIAAAGDGWEIARAKAEGRLS